MCRVALQIFLRCGAGSSHLVVGKYIVNIRWLCHACRKPFQYKYNVATETAPQKIAYASHRQTDALTHIYPSHLQGACHLLANLSQANDKIFLTPKLSLTGIKIGFYLLIRLRG